MKANGICSQPMNQELPMNLPQDALAIHQVFKDSLAFLDGDDLPAAKHWAQSNHRENHLSGTVLFQWFNIWLMHINAAYHCLDCRQVRSEYPSTRQVLHGAAGPFQLSVPLALVIIDRFTNTAVRSRANEFCDLAAEICRPMKALEYD